MRFRKFIIPTLAAASMASPAVPEQRPNILLILADDVGQEVLSCYGGESYATPRIDELAESGMRFRHCYSMPVCHPTRLTLMTGRYPFRLGNPDWGTFPRTAEEQTLGRLLQKAGYKTAVTGKWQLTLLKNEPDHPYRLGFDEYSLFGWHEGPRYYQPLIWQNGKLRTDVKNRYGPDVYTEFLIDFMRRNRKGPFFAYYPMALCHDVSNDLEPPPPFGPKGEYDSYSEMVAAMDVRVGRLVDALEELGLRRSTVVLFTADNGTPPASIYTFQGGKYLKRPNVSIANGRKIPGGKGTLTDAGTHVPLIVNWPGTVKPGETADDLVDFSDFLPTLAELAGVVPPPGLDGRSFAARLRRSEGAGREWVFAQHEGRCWVSDGRWKLYSDGRLFDIHNDFFETSAIFEADENAQQARARARLRQAADRNSLFKWVAR